MKFATTSWLKGLNEDKPRNVTRDRAERVAARHVAVLGGATSAASTATAGTIGLQRLAGLLTGIAGNGLTEALTRLGLDHLVGKDPFDVLDELATMIAGDGDDLDGTAARFAVCDVLDEMYPDAETWEDLADLALTPEQVRDLLDEFLARFIHNRMPVIAERLAQITDPARARQANEEMLEVIRAAVTLALRDVDVSTIDWDSTEGRTVAEHVMLAAYEALETVWED